MQFRIRVSREGVKCAVKRSSADIYSEERASRTRREVKFVATTRPRPSHGWNVRLERVSNSRIEGKLIRKR